MYILSNIICRNYAFQALDLTPESSLIKLGLWSTEPQNSVFSMITIWEEKHFGVYLDKI